MEKEGRQRSCRGWPFSFSGSMRGLDPLGTTAEPRSGALRSLSPRAWCHGRGGYPARPGPCGRFLVTGPSRASRWSLPLMAASERQGRSQEQGLPSVQARTRYQRPTRRQCLAETPCGLPCRCPTSGPEQRRVLPVVEGPVLRERWSSRTSPRPPSRGGSRCPRRHRRSTLRSTRPGGGRSWAAGGIP